MSLESDPTWYKDALIYEMHVRSFFDSNDDGIGDFGGVTQKLGYLQDLGVTTIWLLPFYPSPLKDDGYDIADYTSINPDYGTMDDFVEFLEAAHSLGLRVITELVINHTSDQHPWFQRARRADPGSPERDFYVWSDTVERYEDTRIIFQDFESSNWAWDPVAQQYYWHRFYSHQPDLNFDNPHVHEAIMEVLDFWLDKGVDGLRLDAVPYLYERDGTNCENLPETHQYLKKLRSRVDEKYEDRMLLAEANQWPEDAAAYFGDGDECHMNFHFPLMPRLYLSVERGDRFPIVDILEQTPEIPESCQWATFLRNHDELTLEMVTDEERDYMYRTYAKHQRARINVGIRRRLAPLMGNDRRKIELMHALLFALPGTPVLYYGDEIGMGDNYFLGDRNGVRTPMQWSDDRNAGFSRTNPQQLFLPPVVDPEYHYEAINVQIQQANSNSLLWAVKRLIALRNRHPVFGSGELRFLHPDNRKILAFIRETDDETVLIVANLSRYPQAVELDLSAYHGSPVRELSGRTDFPTVGEGLYPLSLGGHSFLYFGIGGEEQPRTAGTADGTLPSFEIAGEDAWTELVDDPARARLEDVIRESITARRWFHRERQDVRSVRIGECIDVDGDSNARLVLVEVDYTRREPETYTLPLALVSGEDVEHMVRTRAVAYARVKCTSTESDCLLVDAIWLPAFTQRVLAVGRQGQTAGRGPIRLKGEPMDQEDEEPEVVPRMLGAEETNTSVAFEDEWVLKLYRRLQPGQNPEVEMSRYLTEKKFEHTPDLGGVVQLVENGVTRATLAIVQRFIENEGSAWSHALDELELYFEDALSSEASDGLSEPQRVSNPYVEAARLLGRRTAELHGVLAEGTTPDFAPERFSRHHHRSLYQSMRNLWGEVRDDVRRAARDTALPDEVSALARRLLTVEDEILARFATVRDGNFDGARTRIHGDLHLDQFLYTGKNFVVTGFEGEPARPASERRIKRSPLRDVASMQRSFRYATHGALEQLREQGIVSPTTRGSALATWAQRWTDEVGAAFLTAYLAEAVDLRGSILPSNDTDLRQLLEVFILARAVYEVGYELDNRPAVSAVPMRDVLTDLGHEPTIGEIA